MTDLVKRASDYATKAHQRIDQRRKYSKQPYHVHLEAVAKTVAGVTDDPETIAAAWLHDTVEDTPATLEDIEEHFGQSVAELVEELTDVSKPSDGNRAKRKAIDRSYLAQASVRAKTVKLADLIDNCKDIARHDRRFARVYLPEMGALLEVLGDGDETLYREAGALYAASMHKLGLSLDGGIRTELWEPETIGLAGFDDQQVVIVGPGPQFQVHFGYRQEIARLLNTGIAQSEVSEHLSAADFEPAQVIGIVNPPHAVGVAIDDAVLGAMHGHGPNPPDGR